MKHFKVNRLQRCIDNTSECMRGLHLSIEALGDRVMVVMKLKMDATKTEEQIYCDCFYGYGENLQGGSNGDN